MKVELVGKNGFSTTKAIEDYATSKLQKVEQFFGEGVLGEARVVCKVYSDHHKVEVTIPAKNNLILRAEVSNPDMYAAIDLVIDKLLSQVRKYKDRLNRKMDREGFKVSYDNNLDINSLEKEVLASQLVKNKQVELKPMTAEEAINQMELMGHDFFVYLDKNTMHVTVVYLREDGDYATIETR